MSEINVKETTQARQPMDPQQLRRAFSTFVTGVTIITCLDRESRPVGCTVNSFTSVSLEPALVSWNQALTARSYAEFVGSETFVVNILARDQAQLSQRFSSSKIDDKFQGVEWLPGIDGCPLLVGSAAVLQCRKVAVYPGGDHSIFIGQVEQLSQVPEPRPLIFGLGSYLRMEAQPVCV